MPIASYSKTESKLSAEVYRRLKSRREAIAEHRRRTPRDLKTQRDAQQYSSARVLNEPKPAHRHERIEQCENDNDNDHISRRPHLWRSEERRVGKECRS